MQEHSDGSTASYYELPEWACELADLIRYKGMNGAQSEMFRALYRGDSAEHSDEQRQAKKLLCYAIDEVVRTHFPGQSFKPYRDAAFSAVLGLKSVAPAQDADKPDSTLTEPEKWTSWLGNASAPSDVRPDQLVEITIRNGRQTKGTAAGFSWRWHDDGGDIIAYRLAPEALAPDRDWLPWGGQLKLPNNLDPNQLVEVKRRDGLTIKGQANDFPWLWLKRFDSNIVAYRIVTEPPAQDSDDRWIPWAGKSERPDNVDPDQLVEVRLWDGATEQGLVGYFDWEHTGPRNSDIVAYRILDGEADNGRRTETGS